MKNRREFIKAASYGIAAMAMPGLHNVRAETSGQNGAEVPKKIRIGIIGAENTHSFKLGRFLNQEKKFPGISVDYIWGETDEFARISSERGSIPNIVKDPLEMLGKIDAVVVDHRHAKYHLEAALPFVKAGIPAFIDKPFCYRVEAGKDFLKTAEEIKTPVTSFSEIAQSDRIADMKAQIPEPGNIEHIVWYGPADVDSQYGGIFFYGVHTVQSLMNVFGEDIIKVRFTRNGRNATASVVFQSGYFATLIFTKARKWSTTLVTAKGPQQLESRVQETDFPKHYRDMIDMFRTGVEPRSHKSILKCVAVLEALEKSASNQQWEPVASV